jgi:6-phosphogluconolactonase
VHPSGKFVYGSNRGADSIAVFSVDAKAGTLAPVEQVSTQGKMPRNFAIDPTGAYLLAANQQSNNIVVFRIDQSTGRLTPTGDVVDAPSPVCLTFAAAK